MNSMDAPRGLGHRREWTDRFRDGGGSGIGRPTGYNVDLAFTLEDEPDTQRRRRLVLIAEALKAIANADARLLTWNFVEPAADRWVHLRLVLTTTWPGEAAALSEEWMASAIAAANLASDSPAARVPAPRGESPSPWIGESMRSVTAQVYPGAIR
jgi:hypothetical protein